MRSKWYISLKAHSADPMAVKIFFSSAHPWSSSSVPVLSSWGFIRSDERKGGKFAPTDRLFGAESSERREGWSPHRRIGRGGREDGKGMSQRIISERITFLLFSRRETPICSTVHIPQTMRFRREKYRAFPLLSFYFFSSHSLFHRNFLPKHSYDFDDIQERQ